MNDIRIINHIEIDGKEVLFNSLPDDEKKKAVRDFTGKDYGNGRLSEGGALEIKRGKPVRHKAGPADKPEGGTMRNLRFIPTGKIYLTPGQKQARYIRMLERWVVALAVVCGGLMVLIYLLYIK